MTDEWPHSEAPGIRDNGYPTLNKLPYNGMDLDETSFEI